MLRFLHISRYAPECVRTVWVESGRQIEPAVEAAIEAAWRETNSRPGVSLFDGPIGRFEGFSVDGGVITIRLSRTSYRIFVGTNFSNPGFADTYGEQVMANGLGVSAGLLTSDGYIIMGRRNGSVAYYPHRVHPFAGSLEVADVIDLAANARRELCEEANLQAADLAEIHLLCLAEDRLLRHPESIFMARTVLSRATIERQVDPAEHHDSWAVEATATAISRAVVDCADLTPIARAVLLAFGRHAFGEQWFEEHLKVTQI
ncbi:MAG TPA: NUDIX hydrolase [Tepidisphaeraceae bacterium]|jgi:8-oxo-dGTP pyrophosphatase MutT (NUDIX family)